MCFPREQERSGKTSRTGTQRTRASRRASTTRRSSSTPDRAYISSPTAWARLSPRRAAAADSRAPASNGPRHFIHSGWGEHHHMSPTHGAQEIRPHKSSTSAPLVSTAAAAISGPFSSPKGQASRLPSRPPFRPPAFALPSPCPPSLESFDSLRLASSRPPARFDSPVTVIGTGRR